MVIAVVWRKKFVSRGEFIAAGAVCAGLIIFAQADAKLEPDFDPIGIAMVILSVCADAFLPNLQVIFLFQSSVLGVRGKRKVNPLSALPCLRCEPLRKL